MATASRSMNEASVPGVNKNTAAVYSYHYEGQGFFVYFCSCIQISAWGQRTAKVFPRHSGRTVESGLVDFLIELERGELNNPLGQKGSVDSIDRQFDRVDVR